MNKEKVIRILVIVIAVILLLKIILRLVGVCPIGRDCMPKFMSPIDVIIRLIPTLIIGFICGYECVVY